MKKKKKQGNKTKFFALKKQTGQVIEVFERAYLWVYHLYIISSTAPSETPAVANAMLPGKGMITAAY